MVAPLRIQFFLFVLCGARAEQGDEYQSGMYPKEVEHCISFQRGQYWQSIPDYVLISIWT